MTQRVIKYRAWDGKSMFYPSQITFGECGWSVEKGRGVSIPYQPHVVLIQFTGLLDKHGKEVYEGDLLRIKFKTQYYDLEAIYEVVHRGFTTQFVIRLLINPSEVFTDIHLEAGKDFEWYVGQRLEITYRSANGRESSSDIEVIGNIYTTPELVDPKMIENGNS
jgi:uncharacterized phage protein (TIGR01671 family)